jgi:gliding motility-associated-like protein
VPVTVNDGTNSSPSFNLQITVTPVNDAPQIIGQVPISVGESQPVTLTLSHLTVFDPDNSYPTGFSMFVLAGANYSVSGTTVTPAANFSGALQVGVFVSDGSAMSAVYNVQILVNSVNDPPVITGQSSITSPEDQAFTVQLSHLTVSDPDNTYPADFTLQVLSGTNYTFSGNTVTPATNFNGTLTVQVSVNDGIINSAPFGLQVQITAVNDAPVITGQATLSTNEETSITLQLSNLTVTDPDNTYPTGFTMTAFSGSNYTVSGLTVTPAVNFNGVLSVPVRVNDGAANSANFNLQITVNPVNDPPVITGQTALSTMEEQPVTIAFSNLTVTDVDDTYPTGFTISVQPGANYTASGATVTPANNFTGALSVNVVVNDGSSNSAPFVFTIQVNPSNDTPVITGQVALSTNEEQPYQIKLSDLTVNDPDSPYPTGFTLALQAGSNYTFTGTTLTPAVNFNGVLSVPVTVNDGNSTSAPFNVQITVLPVNDVPVITAQATLSTTEDVPLTLTVSNFTISDPDDVYPSGFTLSILPGTNYTVSGTTLTPAANFVGDLIVGVTVNDGTANSAVYQATVRVNGVNDPPVSSGFTPITLTEDDPNTITVDLTKVFSDQEDGSSGLTFTIVSNDKPAYFQTIGITGSTLSFKLAANAFGVANITVRATDKGGLTVQSVQSVTINAVNDPPSFNLINDVQITENAPVQTITITGISPGPLESQSMSFSVSSGNLPLIPQPTVTYNGTGTTATLSFQPVANQTGSATITVKITDTGLAEFTDTFVIEVQSINDPPTLNPISAVTVNEDADQTNVALTGITAGPSESQVLTVTASSNNAALFDIFQVAYQSPQNSGTLQIKPKANAFGVATVTVRVTDNGSNVSPNVNFIERTFTFTVTSVNDTPVITSTPVTEATVGELYQYSFVSTDVDAGQVLTISALQKPTWMTLTAQGNGLALLSGTPPANAAGQSVVRIQVRDAGGLTAIQEYTLVVNTRPTVVDAQATVAEDNSLGLTSVVFVNAFTDADNDALTSIQVVGLPKRGQLLLSGTPVTLDSEIAVAVLASLSYQPATNFNGKDTILWKGKDQWVYSALPAKLVITVTAVNDAPEIVGLETDVLEVKAGEGPAQLSLLVDVMDVDDDSLVSAEIGFRRTNFAPSEDILTFTATANVSGNYNSTTGILTLSGKAPKSEYVTVLRSIYFENISRQFSSEEVDKIIAYTINDGTSLSITRDRAIKLIDRVDDVLIPNGFTPNDDGDNDLWTIPGLDKYPNAIVRVFDIYGRLLFSHDGQFAGWDGMYNGQLLPSSSYYYTIDLNLVNREQLYKGAVNLLR